MDKINPSVDIFKKYLDFKFDFKTKETIKRDSKELKEYEVGSRFYVDAADFLNISKGIDGLLQSYNESYRDDILYLATNLYKFSRDYIKQYKVRKNGKLNTEIEFIDEHYKKDGHKTWSIADFKHNEVREGLKRDLKFLKPDELLTSEVISISIKRKNKKNFVINDHKKIIRMIESMEVNQVAPNNYISKIKNVLKSRTSISNMYRRKVARCIDEYIENEIIKGRNEKISNRHIFIGRILSFAKILPQEDTFDNYIYRPDINKPPKYSSFNEYLRQTVKGVLKSLESSS